MGRNYNDISGKKFNKLTVVSTFLQEGERQWKCICDCGLPFNTTYNYLINNISKDCGCGFKLTKENLYRLYIEEKKTLEMIGNELGVHRHTVSKYLKIYGISKEDRIDLSKINIYTN